jgi:hypothetical protein
MFRFTIRELVLLTLVVAISIGWWVDRGRMSNEVRRLNVEFGQVTWNYTWCILKLKKLGFTPEFRDELIRDFAQSATNPGQTVSPLP